MGYGHSEESRKRYGRFGVVIEIPDSIADIVPGERLPPGIDILTAENLVIEKARTGKDLLETFLKRILKFVQIFHICHNGCEDTTKNAIFVTMDYTTLMSRRIRRILLICNNYDSFALEEDGKIETQIAQEYAELNLSNPPAITRAESTMDALALLKKGERFDLILTMYNVGDLDVFEFSKLAKDMDSSVPIVLLCGFAKEIFRQIESRDQSCIDHIFCWNNSTDLIIAIIKLIEDDLNAENDILSAGVQAILLVEDSIRYYSTYLPALFRIILNQNNSAVKDALNERQQMARKRARPKILMAKNFDDAKSLYDKYKANLLGVISDVGFIIHRGDPRDKECMDAGIQLCNYIKEDIPTMPVLMQSSQESMREVAARLGVGFIKKTSTTLNYELAEYIEREFGFGDFIVTDPKTGKRVVHAGDLCEFEHVMETIPAKYFKTLAENNYLSKWLFARGLFDVGKAVRKFKVEDFKSIEENKMEIAKLIHDFRIKEALGVVAKFDRESFNDAIWFSSLGDGSLGGKARGLAFLNHILHKYNLYDQWDGVRVLVPKTLVVTTEYFDRFIVENGLQYVINSKIDDEEILSEFVASRLCTDLLESLRAFIRTTRKPLAIRSSSKLEDSYYQPFAGVYSTYMIPRTENEDQELRLLSKAIKSVYASVYFDSSRRYITSAASVVSEEKMGIVIQEICGNEDSGYYLPTISGVARSVNFYPLGNEKAEDGIVKIAYGLGKAVVDGEQVLRFSPTRPKHVIQTSTPELTISDTQKVVMALNLQPELFKTSINDAINISRLDVTDCTSFRSFKKVVSTWDRENMRMVDSAFPQGPKYITFAPVLRYNSIPLPQIITRLLEIAKLEMKCNVEIEFAVDMDVEDENTPSVFNVLQIRPISADSRFADINWAEVDTEGAFLSSGSALGTGWTEGVRDIVYLRREAFDVLKTNEMAAQITRLNKQFQEDGKGYVLIGFGRWGTSIPSLGVPVKWSDISEARAIVECSLENFRVDPSQGTHFFQNLTSFNVGYINVDPFGRPSDELDFSQLDRLPAVWESEYVRHVRLDKDVAICVDGKNSKAIMKL